MQQGRRLVGIGVPGTPYADPGGAPCFELMLPRLPTIVTGKIGAEIFVAPDRCVVIHGRGSVVTPAGAKTLAHRIATRTPLIVLDVEPMTAHLIRGALLDVLAWLAASETAA